MSNNYPMNPLSILEEGSKIFFGIDEVLFKNIETCNFLRELVSTSFGPEGMNKCITQNSGKTLITNNAFDILKNLELIHPISKLLTYFMNSQESNLGDSTGFLIIFATEILKKAFDLLREGFHISEIIENFSEAGELALEFIESLGIFKLTNLSNVKVIESIIY